MNKTEQGALIFLATLKTIKWLEMEINRGIKKLFVMVMSRFANSVHLNATMLRISH